MKEIRAAIENNNRKFSEAFMRGDAAAVAALYTGDARLLPPDVPMMRGREAIQSFWQGAMNMGIKEATLETIEVEATGDNFACEVGRFALVIAPGAGAGGEHAVQAGKYVVLWKNDGGVWKLHADIWNADAPV
ncbi:MAG: YybH family protein [Pyrinomonadaceae bacterium]